MCLKVLSSIAMSAAWKDLRPAIEKQGMPVELVLGTGGSVTKRVAEGEIGDVLVAPSTGVDALEAAGKILGASSRRIASCAVGFAVRKGAKRPDISTVAALKSTLLAARCIAYSDPIGGGASGVFFAELLERLGIRQEVDARAKKASGAMNAEALVSGEADLAVQQIPELFAVQGIEVIGEPPPGMGSVTWFSAGVIGASGSIKAATHAVALLASDEAKRILTSHGFDP